jgi:transposase-like protein
MEKGEAIGMEKGEAIGMEKAVINGHRNGYSIEDIANFTGLSHEDIIRILKRYGLC